MSADGFALTATKDIEPGEQIYLNYGSKSNGRFFVSYGFIPSNAYQDDAQVTASLNIRDKLYNDKARLLGCCAKNFRIRRFYDDELKSLLSFIRLSITCRLNQYVVNRINQCLPISRDNEIAALRELKRLCRAALKPLELMDYETTDLERTLSRENINLSNVLQIRNIEKRVLSDFCSSVDIALEVVNKNEIHTLVQGNGEDTGWLTNYLKDINYEQLD